MTPERSEPPRKIYGVDFSGGADAGKKIGSRMALSTTGYR